MSLVLIRLSSFRLLCLDLVFLFNTCREHENMLGNCSLASFTCFLDTGEIKNRDYIPRYLMFKLLQGVHGQFEPIFGGAVRHPLQHDIIRLDPVADALLHH